MAVTVGKDARLSAGTRHDVGFFFCQPAFRGRRQRRTDTGVRCPREEDPRVPRCQSASRGTDSFHLNLTKRTTHLEWQLSFRLPRTTDSYRTLIKSQHYHGNIITSKYGSPLSPELSSGPTPLHPSQDFLSSPPTPLSSSAMVQSEF